MFSVHPVLWEHPPSSPLQGYAILSSTSKLPLKRDKGPMHLSTEALPALKTLGSQYLGNLNLSYFVNLLPAELGVLCTVMFLQVITCATRPNGHFLWLLNRGYCVMQPPVYHLFWSRWRVAVLDKFHCTWPWAPWNNVITHPWWFKVTSHDVFSHTSPSQAKLKGGPGCKARKTATFHPEHIPLSHSTMFSDCRLLIWTKPTPTHKKYSLPPYPAFSTAPSPPFPLPPHPTTTPFTPALSRSSPYLCFLTFTLPPPPHPLYPYLLTILDDSSNVR